MIARGYILARMEGRALAHSLRVGDTMVGFYATVGYLHDVVEDLYVPMAAIRTTFGDAVAEAVASVTRRDREQYFDFILRCKRHAVGRIVKIADLEDNLRDLPQDHSLRKRYEKALVMLR
jgi:(p)ppGpp synthase/HD superfamily hydrolase